MIKNLIASLAVGACLAGASFAQAPVLTPGPAPNQNTIGGYNPATGQIIVSVNNVLSWYIESSSGAMTGAAATLPPIGGALNTDNDARIGQSSFGATLTYADANLGLVAALGKDLSDFVIKSSAAFGAPEVTGQMVLLGVPEPASAAMAALAGIAMVGYGRRKRS